MKKVIIALCLSIFSLAIVFSGCGKKQEEAKSASKQSAKAAKVENKKDHEGQIHAAHILLMYKGSNRAPEKVVRTKEEALALAQDLLKQIKGGADFGELAKTYSDCPSAKRGGDLGYFGKDQMDKSFEKAAFALKKGKVSKVVETDFGYHIIKRL